MLIYNKHDKLVEACVAQLMFMRLHPKTQQPFVLWFQRTYDIMDTTHYNLEGLQESFDPDYTPNANVPAEELKWMTQLDDGDFWVDKQVPQEVSGKYGDIFGEEDDSEDEDEEEEKKGADQAEEIDPATGQPITPPPTPSKK